MKLKDLHHLIIQMTFEFSNLANQTLKKTVLAPYVAGNEILSSSSFAYFPKRGSSAAPSRE